jgi:hypothetical protein
MIDCAEPHHAETALTAEAGSSDGNNKVEASAPANSTAPPAAAILSSDSFDSTTSFVPVCETTNHRTDAPISAAFTADTSPTPPGGEITTNEFAEAYNFMGEDGRYERFTEKAAE